MLCKWKQVSSVVADMETYTVYCLSVCLSVYLIWSDLIWSVSVIAYTAAHMLLINTSLGNCLTIYNLYQRYIICHGTHKNYVYKSKFWFMGQRKTTYSTEKHCGDTPGIEAYLCDIQSRKLAPVLTPPLSITWDSQWVSMCLLRNCLPQ